MDKLATLLSLVRTCENSDIKLARRIAVIANVKGTVLTESCSLNMRHIHDSRYVPPIVLIRYVLLLVLPNLHSKVMRPKNNRETLALRLYLIVHVLTAYAETHEVGSLERLARFALSLKPTSMIQSPLTGYCFPSGLMTNSLNSSYRIGFDYGVPETPLFL